MVEADLERAEERAELGEKYVNSQNVVDCCVLCCVWLIVVDFVFLKCIFSWMVDKSLFFTRFYIASDAIIIGN